LGTTKSILWLPGIAWAIMSFILSQTGLSWSFSLVDGLISSLTFVLMVWIGMLAVNNYPTKVGLLIYAIVIGIAAGYITWVLDKLILNWWFNEDASYIALLRQSELSRLIISTLATTWLISLAAVNKRTTVVEEQFKNMKDAATLHREAELFKLRQQLQPHFLYNSLNSIGALIMMMPEKAQEMIGKLSDFLRNSVKREGREHIPINEELEYIEAYLAIEGVRFGDRLQVAYNKGVIDDATIPPFLLQPILENAIKFGLYGKIGKVLIQMEITLEESYLKVSIRNPYDPQNRFVSGTGFGLAGIERRLYLLYARTDLLEVIPDVEPNDEREYNFTTILKIPQEYA
jgi:sensor histidine kinase YesM